MPLFVLLVSVLLFSSCQKNTTSPASGSTGTASLYFPPLSGTEWQTASPASLGWNEVLLNDLYPYLQSKNTKAFMILKDGKIVVERYFGTFSADSLWYWASAGKTLTAFLAGLAQEEGLLTINDKTSRYLGAGWTSEPLAKENLITVRHQLTMTTGLDDGAGTPIAPIPPAWFIKQMPGQDGCIIMQPILCFIR